MLGDNCLGVYGYWAADHPRQLCIQVRSPHPGSNDFISQSLFRILYMRGRGGPIVNSFFSHRARQTTPAHPLTPLPAIYISPGRVRGLDTDYGGRRAASGNPEDGLLAEKDLLPAYDGLGRPPKYHGATDPPAYLSHV